MFTLLIYLILIGVGTMMAILYKRTITTANCLNPDPKISLRIFTYAFVAAVLVTFALSWYSTHVLYKADIPEEGDLKYQNLKTLTIFIINISFLLMMLFANAYSQSLKRIAFVPYLLTFGFYAIFILRDAYAVSPYYFSWAQNFQLIDSVPTDITSMAHYKCFLGFITTAHNAGAIWWSLKK